MSENLTESLFEWSHFPIRLSTRPPMLNTVALPLHFPSFQKKVENLDYSSVMLQSVTWKGGIKAGEPEATWSRTSPIASQKHRHLSSEGHVATLENHVWKIIPNRVQNIDFRWNRLRGVNTNKTEDFKNLWNVHSRRVVFCTWWGFRFSSHLSLPSQTKVSEAAGPWKATVKRP